MIATQDTGLCPHPTRRSGGWTAAFGRLHLALATRRQRARLAALDAHLLNDIGLNAQIAEEEAARSLWDVPSHWKR